MDQYMRENNIEGVPSKEAKVREPEEVNVEDKNKKTKVPAKDKAATELKAKVDS